MHILFLTDNFAPEVNAPANRTYEHCREWVRRGTRVTVITCVPNFPSGTVFDGYRNRLWQCEEMDGIRVIRVWSFITANEGFFLRVLDQVSFMFMAFFAGLFVRRIDVIVGTSPQFFTVWAARALSAIRRVPWIFELRDIWPESIRAVGAMRHSRILDLLERIEIRLYHGADLIVAVTHAFRRRLVERGVDGDKIAVVTNGANLSEFKRSPRDRALIDEIGLEGMFVVGYIGTHGLAHALDTALDAARILQDDPDAADVRFLFLGAGAERKALWERVVREGIDNTIFLDTVPRDQVARYWSILDLSLIHLRDTELFSAVIPSKIFESMAMGIPILHGVRGESADIILQCGAGSVVEPENPAAIADAIRTLRADPDRLSAMSRNGIAGAVNFDRKILAGNMLKKIEGLLGWSGRPPRG